MKDLVAPDSINTLASTLFSKSVPSITLEFRTASFIFKSNVLVVACGVVVGGGGNANTSAGTLALVLATFIRALTGPVDLHSLAMCPVFPHL